MQNFFEYLRETVDETAKHENRQDLHKRGDDPAEAVQQQRGDQYRLTALGVGQATPEIRAEHHPLEK